MLLLVSATACGGGGATAPPTGDCNVGTTTQYSALNGNTNHVPSGQQVTYSSNPASIGQHWSDSNAPASTGVYPTRLEEEIWVHNLEHGSIVFLYDCPAACTDIELGLQDFAEARPADGGGAFRYIVSPQPNMPTKVAVVAWGWVYRADCVKPAEIDAFVDAHYRQAPEDFPNP